MKIIEALKQIKSLEEKAKDLRTKVTQNAAQYDYETPVYGSEDMLMTDRIRAQMIQVESWIQAHHDTLKEILRLRTAVQKTNLATDVTIDFGNGKPVTKSIAEWVIRRRDLAKLDQAMYQSLTDGNRREGRTQAQGTDKILEVKIRRYFDAAERDKQIEFFRTEPMKIDSQLEITNAITGLIEE